jgi:hypothetical protein
MTTRKSEPARQSPEPQAAVPPSDQATSERVDENGTNPAKEAASATAKPRDHETPERAVPTSEARQRRISRDNKDEPDDDDDEPDDDDDEPEDEDDDDDREPEDEDDDDDEPEDEDDDDEPDARVDDDRPEGETADEARERESTPPPRVRRRVPKPWGHLVPPTIRFVVAVVLLDVMVNVRYPLDEPALWYLIPSTDIALILLNYAILALLRGSIPRWVHTLVVVWLFLVRFIRLGDGIKGRYFGQRFNAYSDLGLVPDGLRFLHSTRPIWEIALFCLLALALLAGLAILCYRALRVVQDYFSDRRQVTVAFGLFGVTFVAVAGSEHGAKFDEYYSGGVAASAMPRLEDELAFVWNVRSQKAGYGALVSQTETMLDGLPSDLAKLHGANVYLILVESYGRTMFELPAHVEASRATFDAFEKELTAKGFSIASGTLNSTTYGGQSWLAHATLDTGVPVHGQLEYEIVCAKKPKSIATFFRRAGYRTVLAQPNTTRALTGSSFYDFDSEYLYKDFGYRGPDYAWATMPDQYVLDVIRRREMDGAKRPLFIQYVLISSHAPWARLPTVLDDWSKLGDGSIFNKLPVEEFPIEWPHFENATEAYGKSIIYDFDVLRRYLADYVKDGSLVIILGDHQPVAEVTGDSWEFGVPVHVLSRDPELVRPFLTRGYRRGIRPNFGGYAQGLETLLPSLLVDYSTEPKLPPN